MAAITLFCAPFWYAQDADGNPLTGAKLYVYEAGTSTPQAVYHDSDLSTAWTQPITTNSAGQSTDPVYLSPTPALKLVATDADDVALSGYPMDNYSPAAVGV